MSTHSPKIAALLAFDADLLSAAGTARVERHLESCEPCRTALSEIRAYERAVAEARRAKYPEPDWSKMELPLARVAREEARKVRGGVHPAWAVAALAAAAGLAVWAAWRGAPTTDPDRAEPPRIARHDAPPEAPAMFAHVTAVSGEARAEAGATAVAALVPGTELREGTRLVTGRGGRLDLALADATGIVLGESSATVLARLREGTHELALERGVVSSQVRHLGAGERYEIVAGRYTVSVHGTRFAVTRAGQVVTVTVDEGVVGVSEAGHEIALVHAPGTWTSSADGQALAQGSVPRARAIDVAAADWPTLHLPSLPNIRQWRFDDSTFIAAGELATRVPVGRLALVAVDDRGRELLASLDVTAAGATLLGSELRPGAPEVRRGYLPMALIQPVVAAGSRGLRQCVDLTLNVQPNLALGAARLRLTVGLTGEVQRVSVEGDGWEIPASLAACITRNVQNWSFPPPTGGTVTLGLPLNLRSRG